MRYVLDFGTTGLTPGFLLFSRLDTNAALTPPSIFEIGSGVYGFDYPWESAPPGLTSLVFKAAPDGTIATISDALSDVLNWTPVTSGTALVGTSNSGVPPLPTGVLEPSGRFFTDFFVEAVKRRTRMPISQATFDTWEVLSVADEQIRSYVVPLMLNVREDYMTARTDVTVSGTVTNYRPPSRSMKVREVQVLDPAGKELSFPRIDLDETPFHVDGFTFIGNDLVFVDPSRWDSHVLRWTYYLRPSRLVTAAEAGIVQGVNRGTGVITLYGAIAGLTGATSVDLVRGTPPFEVAALDVVCTVSGATVTITAPANIPAAWGSPGDLVCLPQQAPAPQIHPDLWNLLVQAVAVDLLDGNGDDGAFQRAVSRLKKMDADAKTLLTPRVEGEPLPTSSHNGIWDRPWLAR